MLYFALLAVLALWLGASTRPSTHRSSPFLIPEGYTGWVRIEFEVRSAPPLPTEGGQYVFTIPSDGVLRTPSAEQYGWAKDQYYYYSAQGVRGLSDSGPAELIWGKINGQEFGATRERKYEEFFGGMSSSLRIKCSKRERVPVHAFKRSFNGRSFGPFESSISQSAFDRRVASGPATLPLHRPRPKP
jgi:uncharacterized protein DUF6843